MNKTVIVTGGTRGIGFAIAKAFVLNGDKVVMNYRSDTQQAEQALQSLQPDDSKVIAFQANISVEEDREHLLCETLDHFNSIDVLINNAGIAGKESFLKETEETFHHIMDNNLTGAIFLSQRVVKTMIDQAIKGSIIHIGSTAAHASSSGSLSYCVAKAGLLMATQHMAYKLGPYGIRVNCITPGGIETDMSRHAWSDPERKSALEEVIPLRRRGQPDEVAGAALYLASDQASYTTGADIIVDGGWLLRSGSSKA